jgi:hypothetical protein
MRMMYVQVLWPEGHVEWKQVAWGKRGLDYVRKLGGTVIGYSE